MHNYKLQKAMTAQNSDRKRMWGLVAFSFRGLTKLEMEGKIERMRISKRGKMKMSQGKGPVSRKTLWRIGVC